jgi:hypothetical protein
MSPVDYVKIGVADSARHHPDLQLACLRWVELELLDRERLSKLM